MEEKKKMEIPDAALQHVMDIADLDIVVVIGYKENTGTIVAMRGGATPQGLLNVANGLQEARNTIGQEIGTGFLDFMKDKNKE